MTETRAHVAATSVETGRFVPTEQSLGRAELIDLVAQLSAREEGYVEVRVGDADLPVLLVGFRRGLAVVQCMWDGTSMSLLTGDGSVPGPQLVEVLVMDDLASFTGEYVMGVARAQEVLLRFADGSDARSLGEWHEL